MKTCFPLFSLVALVFAASAGSAKAGPQEEIIRLSQLLEQSAIRLRGNFEAGYRNTPQFRTLIASVNDVRVTAARIHDLSYDTVWAARSLRGNVVNMQKEVVSIHDFLDRADSQGYRQRDRKDAVHRELGTLERLLAQLDYQVNLRIRRHNEAISSPNWQQPGYATPNYQQPNYQRPGYPYQPPTSRPQAPQRPSYQQRPTTSNQWQRPANTQQQVPLPPDPRDFFRFMFGQ